MSLFDVQIQPSDKAVAKGFAVFRSSGKEDEEFLLTASHVI